MPLGVFPTFSLGAYHAANSSAIVNDRCLPRSFCNLTVTTALFGDPFPGQQKHLSVVATCSRVKTSTIIRRPRGPASTSSGSVASSSPSLLSTTRPLPTSLRGSKSATSYSRLSAAAAMRSTHAPRPPPSSQVSSNSPNVSMSVIVVAGAVTAIVIILGLCFCATFHAGRFASIRKQDSDQRRPAPSFPVGIPTRPVAISNVYDPAMFAGGRYPVVAPTSQGMVNMPPTWPNHLPSLSDADHHLSPSRRFRRSEAVDKFNNGARTLTTSSDTEYG
ncbi:SUEL-type lectin domain-containing protein [Plasmodiophora brassicae]